MYRRVYLALTDCSNHHGVLTMLSTLLKWCTLPVNSERYLHFTEMLQDQKTNFWRVLLKTFYYLEIFKVL